MCGVQKGSFFLQIASGSRQIRNGQVRRTPEFPSTVQSSQFDLFPDSDVVRQHPVTQGCMSDDHGEIIHEFQLLESYQAFGSCIEGFCA